MEALSDVLFASKMHLHRWSEILSILFAPIFAAKPGTTPITVAAQGGDYLKQVMDSMETMIKLADMVIRNVSLSPGS